MKGGKMPSVIGTDELMKRPIYKTVYCNRVRNIRTRTKTVKHCQHVFDDFRTFRSPIHRVRLLTSKLKPKGTYTQINLRNQKFSFLRIMTRFIFD